jgi:GT2 family glycosyltransferase
MISNPRPISVVLPNYNGRHLLEENLPSLFSALKYHGAQSEVIVVDDCSSDDSVAFLTEHYPQVRTVVNSSNMGFSASCNRGIAATSKPFVCVANTDVTFCPDYFVNTLRWFEDTNLFAVKGDIYNWKDTKDNILNIERVSELYFRRGLLRFNNKVTPDVDQFGFDLGKQFVLLGCCFVADRSKLVEIGGYNEVFAPYYWEDSDLALNGLAKGYNLKYDPDALVYHQLSSTINTTQSYIKRRTIAARNKYIFCWLHMASLGLSAKHRGFLLLSLTLRFLILDWKFYAAVWNAARRYRAYRGGRITNHLRNHEQVKK